jgi:hypothetical protein
MVGNIVDVGWATIRSGCLPITGVTILDTFTEIYVSPENISRTLLFEQLSRYSQIVGQKAAKSVI